MPFASRFKVFFPDEELAGVPLLDPTIDWNEFNNWPDKLVIRGTTNTLKLTQIDIDVYIPLKSRAEVKPGMEFLASYREGTNFPAAAAPWAFWIRDGSVFQKGVKLHTKDLLSYTFYPNGRLHCFVSDDIRTKEYRLEYFDHEGKLVGVRAHADGKGPARCTWEGREVPKDIFLESCRELLSRKGQN